MQLQENMNVVSEGKIWNQDGVSAESEEEIWFKCGT